MYTALSFSLVQDYPSTTQMEESLTTHNIIPIFAVDGTQESLYEVCVYMCVTVCVVCVHIKAQTIISIFGLIFVLPLFGY